MREIKFRVWYKSTGKFVYFELGETNKYPSNVMDFPVQQFTGLRDKNNVPIFEGDIIKVPDDYDVYGFMSGEVREVYFNAGGFRLRPLNDERKAPGHWIEDNMVFEVLGNIHENKDLLTPSLVKL